MLHFRPIYGLMRYALLAVAVYTAIQTPAFAQAAGSPAGEGGGNWVWGYMIVILVVSLGMIAVCKSSGRRDRAKPEVYTEGKIVPKE